MQEDDVPKASGIYKITCTANKKIYIGSALNLRARKSNHFSALRRNKHGNPYLQRAWNKYGEQCFTFEVLELVLEINRSAREQYWFNRLKPFGHKGFNVSRDAATPAHTDEVRKKIGDAFRGRKLTPEHREKMRQASHHQSNWRGKKHTPESIEKTRQALIGRKHSPERIEKQRQSMIGRKHSPETREKLRQANLGKTGSRHTPESLEKLRQANLGRKMPPEAVEKSRQANTGRKLSPEHVEKLRQAQLGKKKSPEAIAKRTESRRGWKQSPEAREKMSQSRTGMKMSPDAVEKNRQSKIEYWARKREEGGRLL
jgi:group I intron endonuclease